ncbi:Fe-S cluster assembly protein SufD [Roseomonas marmotae]|uniref:Fe-S cluster assembly protein SufD n=1 Tax=Roseomonas marmotae TaxID=2768161 RepID=A0ABS3KDQ8_9PROT|nr:Fe-S cluster assembly protein SufD [Roseomonas marmotae]MBO1075611.1 Fe-S cluster assembly protein SufD [Roseomonas marmotae]QTI79473.1 Fe-S cluster assembly protein SufD [Roseomonas marmotae]
MNAIFEPGPEGFLRRYEGLQPRLPGTRLPWVAALRARAAEAFRANGFPTRKVEAWHYTDLALLSRTGFGEALTPVDEDVALPESTAPQRAVLIDGRFRADLSDAPVRSLGADLPAAEGLLGSVAKLDEVPLAALNTMLFEDGVLIDLPAGANAGAIELLSIIQASADRPVAVHPRHVIRLGAGAQLVLIERAIGRGEGRYLHNPVVEIELAEGAHLTHARIQQEGAEGVFLSTVFATAAAGATYDSFLLHAGAKLARSEAHVSLNGPKAMAHLNGAQLLTDGQHGDCTTFLDHAAPDCASRQTVKTVLSGKSRGVFQGKIHVHQIAQRTDGYQMNQALLLSDQAEIDSKPQLEIYADDVKCSHGATVGELDEDQLFYLRARGIPQSVARSMLIEAFLQEAVEAIEEETARKALATAIGGWWEKVA